MKNCHYTLFAVWVHQGVAGSGHYWAHIRNPKTNQYIKFNDMRVNQVNFFFRYSLVSTFFFQIRLMKKQ